MRIRGSTKGGGRVKKGKGREVKGGVKGSEDGKRGRVNGVGKEEGLIVGKRGMR